MQSNWFGTHCHRHANTGLNHVVRVSNHMQNKKNACGVSCAGAGGVVWNAVVVVLLVFFLRGGLSSLRSRLSSMSSPLCGEKKDVTSMAVQKKRCL